MRGPKHAAAGMRLAQLCEQGPEQSPARVWRVATAARPAGRACAAGRHTPARRRRPKRARPQTRCGWHAARAAVSTRPRTVTCLSLERRGGPTSGRARLCRWAPHTNALARQRSGWHAGRAAVLTRPRTATCPSLARRNSCTAGRARLHRQAPARQGGRGSSARRRASAPADIRAAQLCQQGPEHSPARA